MNYYGVSYDAGILGIISYVPFCSVILLVACENETVVKFNSSSTIVWKRISLKMKSSPEHLCKPCVPGLLQLESTRASRARRCCLCESTVVEPSHTCWLITSVLD